MPAFWECHRRPMITHTIDSYPIISVKTRQIRVKNFTKLPKIQNLEKKPQKQPYTRHTFLSCLIRCVNMKWIRQILWKLHSGHDSVHRRRTDGRESSIPPFNFVEGGGGGGIIITRVSEVIMFSPCVFVCLCLYHDVCPDDLTMKDWCHTNNILQVHYWGCVVVQVMFHVLMTSSMTSPGHKVGQILKLIYLRQYLS